MTKVVYGVLLSLLGLICIIFNRFAVEESLRIMPPWVFTRLPIWMYRMVVVLAGIFFVFFGLLTAAGYLR